MSGMMPVPFLEVAPSPALQGELEAAVREVLASGQYKFIAFND